MLVGEGGGRGHKGMRLNRHDRNGLVTVAKAEKSFRKVVVGGRR